MNMNIKYNTPKSFFKEEMTMVGRIAIVLCILDHKEYMGCGLEWDTSGLRLRLIGCYYETDLRDKDSPTPGSPSHFFCPDLLTLNLSLGH